MEIRVWIGRVDYCWDEMLASGLYGLCHRGSSADYVVVSSSGADPSDVENAYT